VVDLTRSTGKTLGAFNTTFIELIPKFDNPTSFEKLGQYLYAIVYIKSYKRLLQEG
jgi:hypothetical protein